MKVMDRVCDLTPFCDQDVTACKLGCVRWDAEAGVFVATNSRSLAIAPAGDADETSKELPAVTLHIPAELVTGAMSDVPARALAGDDLRVGVSADGERVSVTTTRRNGPSVTRVDKKREGRFPTWRAVLPSGEARCVTLNVEQVKAICEYAERVGARGRGVAVFVPDKPGEFLEFVIGTEDGRDCHVILADMCSDTEVQRAHEKWKHQTETD